MAPHSRTLAWTVPWTEEPGREESDTTEQLHFLSLSLSIITFESQNNPLA